MPSDWKMRLMFAFCSAKPIWIPKKPNEMFQSPRHPCLGLTLMAVSTFTRFLPSTP